MNDSRACDTTTSSSSFSCRVLEWFHEGTEQCSLEERTNCSFVVTDHHHVPVPAISPESTSVGTPDSYDNQDEDQNEAAQEEEEEEERMKRFGQVSLEHKQAAEKLKLMIRQQIKDIDKFDWGPFSENGTIDRVLVARDLHVEDSFQMFKNIVEWRRNFQPQILSEEDASHYLSKQILHNCGPDRHNRPAIYVASKNHDIDNEHFDGNLRTIVNYLDNTAAKSTHTADGFLSIIIDQTDVGRRNMDTHLFIARPGLVQILQEYYPERLATCYMIHTSWIFRAMWTIISPFLDNKTRSKVKVISRIEDMLDDFELEHLPPALQSEIQAKMVNK